MVRYKAILAYDGTGFSGFQRQAEARTVQGEVETALQRIGWPGQTIYAAGRTDSGVHASGQVIAFDFDWGHSAEDLRNALNANLPADAAIRTVEPVSLDFHPRYDALARRYSYRIFFDPVRDPLRERYAWRLWPALEPEILDSSAQLFAGEHDFSGFGTPPKAGGPTIRLVHTAGWSYQEAQALFTIEANAFLYRMVRRIVQVQVDAAQGKISPGEIEKYLTGVYPEMVEGLAPPNGLSLVEVRYPDAAGG